MWAAIELVLVIFSPLYSHCSPGSLEFDLPNSIRNLPPIYPCKNYWVLPFFFFFPLLMQPWELSHLTAAKFYWNLSCNNLFPQNCTKNLIIFSLIRMAWATIFRKISNVSLDANPGTHFLHLLKSDMPALEQNEGSCGIKKTLLGQTWTSHLTTSHHKYDCFKVIPQLVPNLLCEYDNTQAKIQNIQKTRVSQTEMSDLGMKQLKELKELKKWDMSRSLTPKNPQILKKHSSFPKHCHA